MQEAPDFKKNIKAFEKLLETVVVEQISPESYCQKYLGYLLQHKRYYLAIYADVLEKLSSHSVKNKEEILLLDYGAGNGILGIFAKFCGFKKVFLADIDAKFIEAAQKLAEQLYISIDGFIAGDIDSAEAYFSNEKPDAIAGTDVIEHIYDLYHFFRTTRQMNPGIISVFTTGSNPENYFKVRQLKKLHLKDEYEGGEPGDFMLFGEKALEPFYKTRERIIRSGFEKIDDQDLDKFTTLTRGMNKADILSAIEKYKLSGELPSMPFHPTNTCNPLSSSWTERILTLGEYYDIYGENYFKLEIYNGFYDQHKKGLKSFINNVLNKLIRIFGMSFAPYIIFVGSKK